MKERKVVYTNFEDEGGAATMVALPIGGGSQSFERFKEKVRHFLRPREAELPMQKLRLGLGLTKDDLDALDRMLVGRRSAAATPIKHHDLWSLSLLYIFLIIQ